MYWLCYIVLIFVQPLDSAEQERLSAFMVKVNPDSAFIVRPLVKAIYREAEAKGLDPTVLAAMAWAESWYNPTVKGKSYEAGVWQVWPWASPSLDFAWYELVKQKRIKRFPSVPWSRLSLKDRWKASTDIEIGTYLATNLIKTFRDYCIRKKHDRKRPTDSYAHYNTGFRRPRAGYAFQLWQRTKLIRRRIGRPEFTQNDHMFYGRMSYTETVTP